MRPVGVLLYEDCPHRLRRRLPWHQAAHAVGYIAGPARELGPDELPDGDTVTVVWDSSGRLHLFEKD